MDLMFDQKIWGNDYSLHNVIESVDYATYGNFIYVGPDFFAPDYYWFVKNNAAEYIAHLDGLIEIKNENNHYYDNNIFLRFKKIEDLNKFKVWIKLQNS